MRCAATEEKKIETIIIPAIKKIAQQCAGYGEKLQGPPGIVALMLRDITYAFDKNHHKAKVVWKVVN